MPDHPQPPARPTAKRATTVTRPYGGVKAEARREERRQRLLAAGLEVFGHQGYHHTTVRDVCLAAGLTERYFYESFKSLRLLFDAVHEQLRNELLEVSTPRPSPDGTEPLALGVEAALRQLETSLRLWYRFLQADPRRARIMLFDASVIDDLDAVRPNRAAQEFQAGLMRLVDTLHPDLARHGIQLELTVAALTGALTSHARTWAASHYVTPLEDLVRHSMLVFYGLATLYQALNDGKLVMPSSEPSLSADASAASPHPAAA